MCPTREQDTLYGQNAQRQVGTRRSQIPARSIRICVCFNSRAVSPRGVPPPSEDLCETLPTHSLFPWESYRVFNKITVQRRLCRLVPRAPTPGEPPPLASPVPSAPCPLELITKLQEPIKKDVISCLRGVGAGGGSSGPLSCEGAPPVPHPRWQPWMPQG